MSYPRPLSHCNLTAVDLAGEIIAALSASSIVFQNESHYGDELVTVAQTLFDLSNRTNSGAQVTYTSVNECGGQARQFYNSTSFEDELFWGATWLFFATGNRSYLDYATSKFTAAIEEQEDEDHGVYYWNNKVLPTTVYILRILFNRKLHTHVLDSLKP